MMRKYSIAEITTFLFERTNFPEAMINDVAEGLKNFWTEADQDEVVMGLVLNGPRKPIPFENEL